MYVNKILSFVSLYVFKINLVPRVYVTLVQRSGKQETLGKSVSEDKILVMRLNAHA